MDQTTANRKMRTALIGLESRTQAMFIYGVTAIGIGLAMFFTGVPSDLEAEYGPWVRAYLGFPLSVGGVLLVAGSFLANERRWAWWSGLIGFCIFTLWALTMAIVYVQIAARHGVQIQWPWDGVDPDSGRLYITVFYQGVMTLTGMHVVTLIKMGRPPR